MLGALSQTMLGELTVRPRPPNWIKGEGRESILPRQKIHHYTTAFWNTIVAAADFETFDTDAIFALITVAGENPISGQCFNYDILFCRYCALNFISVP